MRLRPNEGRRIPLHAASLANVVLVYYRKIGVNAARIMRIAMSSCKPSERLESVKTTT